MRYQCYFPARVADQAKCLSNLTLNLTIQGLNVKLRVTNSNIAVAQAVYYRWMVKEQHDTDQSMALEAAINKALITKGTAHGVAPILPSWLFDQALSRLSLGIPVHIAKQAQPINVSAPYADFIIQGKETRGMPDNLVQLIPELAVSIEGSTYSTRINLNPDQG